MMNEKRGVVEPGRTPPETDEKRASEGEALEDHLTKRAADAVTQEIGPAKGDKSGLKNSDPE